MNRLPSGIAAGLAILGTLLTLPAAYAHGGGQLAAAEAPTGSAAVADQAPIEGVTIEAHRLKMGKLRIAIKKSVDDFYEAFNKANTVPGYETQCADQRPSDPYSGSYIEYHVCTPQFVHNATADETQGFFYGYATTPAFTVVTVRMRGYKEQLEKLLHTDPGMRTAAAHFESLLEQYRSVSNEKVRPN